MTDVQQASLFNNGSENGTGARGSRRAKAPLTSKEQLNSTIKSVRDLLRKDAGLSGDTDRLPQLTWLLFLKNFDDFEYAQDANCLDVLGMTEHNHSQAGMQIANYKLGFNQANQVNGVVSPFTGNSIVTLWGMEWGVIALPPQLD